MSTRQPGAHPAMFAALAVPNFRRYVSGQSLSLIGTWAETVAQALLGVGSFGDAWAGWQM
ncbi:MAG TPA: hypothetical protein VGG75_07775 [Trebonia sp.]|jgi:hypothetical protein